MLISLSDLDPHLAIHYSAGALFTGLVVLTTGAVRILQRRNPQAQPTAAAPSLGQAAP
jgi:hypothetical protein